MKTLREELHKKIPAKQLVFVLLIPLVALFIWARMNNVQYVATSFAEASLPKEQKWTEAQRQTAAAVTYVGLSKMADELDVANEHGDPALATQLLSPLLEIMQGWGTQGELGRYRDCQLAAAHFSEMVEQVQSGGRIINPDRFHTTLNACKQLADE